MPTIYRAKGYKLNREIQLKPIFELEPNILKEKLKFIGKIIWLTFSITFCLALLSVDIIQAVLLLLDAPNIHCSSFILLSLCTIFPCLEVTRLIGSLREPKS